MDEDAQVFPPTDHVHACLDEGVDLFSFSFGDASEHAATVQDAGGTVLWSVGSEDDARTALTADADVLVAQGREAGGHVQGEAATSTLVPAVVDLAAPESVPVVAAGGIADGRDVAAVLARGADGAWLGTRFVATDEADAHETYQERLVAASVDETVYSGLFDGGWPGTPHRTLANSTVTDWRAAGEPPTGHRPGEGDVVAELPDRTDVERYSDTPPVAGTTGDPEAMALYAGESVGRIDAVQPAADVVADLIDETCTRINQLGRHVSR